MEDSELELLIKELQEKADCGFKMEEVTQNYDRCMDFSENNECYFRKGNICLYQNMKDILYRSDIE